MAAKGILISAVVLLGISWQFVRSYFLYDGDFIGLATLDKLAIQYALPEVNPLTRSTYVVRGYQKLLNWPRFPRRFKRVIIGLSILMLVFSTLYMTYHVSLPLYLESGLSLEVILNH